MEGLIEVLSEKKQAKRGKSKQVEQPDYVDMKVADGLTTRALEITVKPDPLRKTAAGVALVQLGGQPVSWCSIPCQVGGMGA